MPSPANPRKSQQSSPAPAAGAPVAASGLTSASGTPTPLPSPSPSSPAVGLTGQGASLSLPKVNAAPVRVGLGSMYPSISSLEVPQVLATCAATGRALYLHGAAGIGKSAVAAAAGRDPLVKEIAWKQWAAVTGKSIPMQGGQYPDLDLVMLTLPQHEAEDFVGVPYHRTLSEGDKVTAFAPVDAFRNEHPTVLFLDEVSAAEVRTMKAVLQIVNERKIANVDLTPGTVVILAGNRAEDRAAIRSVPFTLGNRAAHYEMTVDDEAWLTWAQENGIGGPFRAFVKQHGVAALHKFSPADPSLAQLTPRSFVAAAEAYSAGQEMGLHPDLLESLLIANIGAESGMKLSAYLRLNNEVPSWEEILLTPRTARLPNAPDKHYYCIGMLIDQVRSPKFTDEQRPAVHTYLDRLVAEQPSSTDAVAWLMTEALRPNPAKGRGDNFRDIQFVYGIAAYPNLAPRMGQFLSAVQDALQGGK